jgi:hypothetical protein
MAAIIGNERVDITESLRLVQKEGSKVQDVAIQAILAAYNQSNGIPVQVDRLFEDPRIAEIAQGVIYPTDSLEEAAFQELKCSGGVPWYVGTLLEKSRDEKKLQENLVEKVIAEGAEVFADAPDEWKNDVDYVRVLMGVNARVYPYVGEGIKEDPIIALMAARCDLGHIKLMGKAAALAIIESGICNIDLLSEELQRDEQIVRAIITKNPESFNALSAEMKALPSIAAAYIPRVEEPVPKSKDEMSVVKDPSNGWDADGSIKKKAIAITGVILLAVVSRFIALFAAKDKG